MKRRLVILLSLVFVVCSSILVFTACDEEHVHTFDQQVISNEYKEKDATCTLKSSYYYSCLCGEKGTLTFEYGEPLGHAYGEWVTNTDGTHTKTCTNDSNHKVTENCRFTNYVYNNNATCDENGTETATCNDGCGGSNTREKENTLLGHAYGKWVANTDGTHTKTCVNNSNHKITEDCKFTNYVSNNDGTKTATCKCDCTDIIADTNVFNITGSEIMSVTTYGKTLSKIVVPSCIDIINEFAFELCTNLKEIIICEGVTIIEDRAFYECIALEEITLPNSIVSVGESVFYQCNNLRYNWKGNLRYLGNDTNKFLCLCGVTYRDIVSATINEKCKVIADAFLGCSMLEKVEIPNSVISIGAGAFDSCTSLTEIIIPSSVIYMDGRVFRTENSITIYCETESWPVGWDANWNFFDYPVYWYSKTYKTSGNYWRYVNGKPTAWS